MNNWKKPTNQEMVNYYDNEIKRVEKVGGLQAKYDLPYLKEQKAKYQSMTKEWFK